MIFNLCGHGEQPVLERLVQPAVYLIIAEVELRPPDEGHIPNDAAQPPHVLVLQVAPITELIDAHGQQIFSGADQGGNVKLAGTPAALGVAGKDAVYPNMEGALDPVKAQDGLLASAGYHKAGAVQAGRVFCLNDRGLGQRKDGDSVRIVGCAVSVELPLGGYGEKRPFAVVKRFVKKSLRAVVGVVCIVESPMAVQRLEVPAGSSVPPEGQLPALITDVEGPGFQTVDGQHIPAAPILLPEMKHLLHSNPPQYWAGSSSCGCPPQLCRTLISLGITIFTPISLL